jgi:predicted metal-dependent HD superfamily phosphohydrolase
VTEAGATASREAIAAAAQRLLTRWSDPRRAFHNTRHLIDVLTRVDELATGTHAPVLVRLAAFYHGAVFEPQVFPAAESEWEPAARLPRAANWEDEAASALVARSELGHLGVPDAAAVRVAELIAAMEELTPPPGDADSTALIDASLGLLAADPHRYKVYLAQVRQENERLPLRTFLQCRIAAIDEMLARPVLFYSPEAAGWEPRARDNLAGELARNRKELLRLDMAALAAQAGATSADDGVRPAAPDNEPPA